MCADPGQNVVKNCLSRDPELALCVQILAKIANNLLKHKNELGWNATSPAGAEGDSLMQVMHRFAQVISRSLIFHVIDMRASVREASISQFFENIGQCTAGVCLCAWWWRGLGGGICVCVSVCV